MTGGQNRSLKLPPDPLTRDEAEALLAQCNRKCSRGLRNYAHLMLLYRSALRSKESCDLDLSDVRLEQRTVRVLRPKGSGNGKAPREVGIDLRTWEAIYAWVQVRGAARGPLFLSSNGRRLHPSYLRQLLPTLAEKAGITRRVHPHGLRHTCARELYEEGVGVRDIQNVLGHGALNTTAVYLSTIGADSAASVLQER